MGLHSNKIFVKRPWHFFWIAALWMTIFFPSIVKGEFLGLSEIWSEVDTSILESSPGRSEYLQECFFGNDLIVFNYSSKFPEFISEGSSEQSTSFIEIIDFLKFESISVCNPSTKKCSNYGKPASNKCYFVGTRLQFYLYALGGGLCGAIRSVAILPAMQILVHPRRRMSYEQRASLFARPARGACASD